MNEPFTLRAATPGDYGDICVLLAEVDELHRLNLPWLFQKPAVEARPPEFFERLLSGEESSLLVAEATGQIVGVATALMRSAPDFAVFINQKWGVLDNIAIAKSWRRRGVGTALIREAERWLEEQGAHWIELGVYEFNAEARAFYGALGYTSFLSKLRKPF